MQTAVELKFILQYDESKGWLEDKQKEQFKKVLAYLQERPFYQYSYCYVFEEHQFTPTIVAKCTETTYHLMHMFVFGSGVETREFDVCDTPHCYNEVLGAGLDALLFDRYGEQCHEMHERCAQHTSATSRLIRRSIETINETPDKKEMWEKIHVWRLRGKWYSQRIWIESESREMTSPLLYEVASIWFGPFDTRELAIQAARGYEEK
jgi:hypothetical protein